MEHSFAYNTGVPEIVEEGTSPMDDPQRTVDVSKPMALTSSTLHGAYFPQTHQHQESTSTSASDSAGSSPTTTASMADDSSVTEMSPDASPESPLAKNSLDSTTMDSSHLSNSQDHKLPSRNAAFFDLQRPQQTPGKRPRNLKNLAVNTTGSSGTPRAVATSLPNIKAAISETALKTSEPAFSRPRSPPRRKPSNLSLTIMTPATNNIISHATPQIVPPTPSFTRPELRHFQSSPHLPLLRQKEASASAPSVLAMGRPALTRSMTEQPKTNEDEDNFDVPQSREAKPEAYPLGPICVFEPYVDLYLEPTAKQARDYDVILNVANEVRNPFLQVNVPIESEPDVRLDGGGGIQYAPRRDRNTPHSGMSTALKTVVEAPSPTTPKASLPDEPVLVKDTPDKEPEYIHIPWEHNTDIVPDLLRLVKLIDERVKRGKRVLVHCQCGVSRSATLVVAYCMYKSPQMSVQEAYDTVKEKSKWIGPNMNLIMQLQEFRSSLMGNPRRNFGFKSLTPIEASSSWNEWRRNNGALEGQLEAKTPKTAPLPPKDGSVNLSHDYSARSVSPGPSSAPSGITWPSSDIRTDAGRDERAQSVPHASPTNEPITSPTLQVPGEKKRPHSLRFETGFGPIDPDMIMISPRSEQFAMASLQPSAEVAPDDHFGLMSPSTTEFHHSPLDRAALLGSLGMGSSMSDDTTRKRPQNFSYPQRRSIAPTQPPPPASPLVPSRENSSSPATTVIEIAAPPIGIEDSFSTLMSPRATEFTLNPFGASSSDQAKATDDGRIIDDDPRSPAQKGASPINRNIANFL